MNERLTQQLKGLLHVHGEAFWQTLQTLMTPAGLCKCGRPGRLVNMAAAHFGVCDLCRACWWLGEDALAWRHESPGQWAENAKLLATCDMVTCRYLHVYCNIASLFDMSELAEWTELLIEKELQEPAARERVINRVVEAELKGV